jgi:hypothetical protein
VDLVAGDGDSQVVEVGIGGRPGLGIGDEGLRTFRRLCPEQRYAGRCQMPALIGTRKLAATQEDFNL